MIQAWTFLEIFFEAFKSNLYDWPFENPKWRPFFKMAAILHLQDGVGPKKIINSADLNFVCFLVYWNNFLQFCSRLKIENGAFLKMAVNLHKYLVWVIEEKSVSRIEWSWCPFACFKGCRNHILQLYSPFDLHFP